MSQENVERLRTALEAFADQDMAGFIGLMDPEVQFEPHLAALEGRYTGHDGIRSFFADAFETMSVSGIDYPDLRDLGNRVLALGSLQIGGTGSGIDVEVPMAIVATFEDGRITHLKDYGDPAKALEAAGLRE